MNPTKSYKDKWPSDGHEHHEISRDSIYENKKIRNFLDGNSVTLLVASKGMGKTLLMRVKKKLVMDSKEGVTVIPSTDTEFDEPRLHGTYPPKGFSDILLWKDLWSLSIVLSVLTHIVIDSSDEISGLSFLEERLDIIGFDEKLQKETLKEIANNTAKLPSYYLVKFLSMFSEKELQKLRLCMSVIDELSDRYIRSAIVVFVDAFDQTLSETFLGNLDAWKNGQLGLAKAAHTLHTKNHHLKVLATIRQEAWAGFIDDDREVIGGKTLILDYSEPELKKLFVKAIERYTQFLTLGEFLGVKFIENTFCNEQEDTFHYIFRHSTGSARSLMQFGKALDELDLDDVSELEHMRLIRETIDTVASAKIVADYFASQKLMFLKTLTSEKLLRQLLQLIPSNVLTASSLKSLHKAFCACAAIPEERAHPFCELFNSGLLGIVEFDTSSDGTLKQKFRKPYQFDWVHEEILESNGIYLMHPGLVGHISKDAGLKLNRINVIGCDGEWKTRNGHDGIPKVFLSHSSIDKPLLESFIGQLKGKLDLQFPADIWLDKWKIVPGEDIHQEVERGVDIADIVVLFASESSLNSGWVDKEWRTKHAEEISSKNIRVVVAILDKTKPEDLPAFLKGKLAVRMDDIDTFTTELAKAISLHAHRSLESRFSKKV